MNSDHKKLPYLVGVLVAVIFGMSFMFTKNALDTMTPLSVMAFRFGLAAIVLTIMIFLGVVKINFKGKKIKTLLLLTIFQPLLYFPFETWGVQLTSSSEAGIMIAMIPVSVVIFGYFFTKERISVIQGIFILVSVSGIAYIGIKSGVSASGTNFLGYLSLLGAVIAAGIYNIMSRKVSGIFTPVEITFVMMWAAAIVFNGAFAVNSMISGDFSQYLVPFSSLPTLISIFYLGVASSVFAFFMLNYMLSRLPAYKCAVFLNLTPVISVFAGVLFRKEILFNYHIIGCILIIIGVWGTNISNKKEIINDSRSF